jgi:hypothetical protein
MRDPKYLRDEGIFLPVSWCTRRLLIVAPPMCLRSVHRGVHGPLTLAFAATQRGLPERARDLSFDRISAFGRALLRICPHVSMVFPLQFLGSATLSPHRQPHVTALPAAGMLICNVRPDFALDRADDLILARTGLRIDTRDGRIHRLAEPGSPISTADWSHFQRREARCDPSQVRIAPGVEAALLKWMQWLTSPCPATPSHALAGGYA